jgi:hypothetical protein
MPIFIPSIMPCFGGVSGREGSSAIARVSVSL